ncbi:MAG: hypothetical protein M0Z60_02545 [Nitrospiraceae bacterium]|nr:hypothetical protein [Nitrospiraceae bacterium]
MSKKISYVLFFLGVLVLAYGLFLLPKSIAGVHVNVGINLPLFSFPAPPPMVVIPGTYAYYAPDVDVDIFFYHGYWYRPYEDRWFRARGYNGPWVHIGQAEIPRVVVDLPHDYRRHARPGHERIPYGQFKKSWRRWEQEKYWDGRAGGYGNGRGHGGRENERREDPPGRGKGHGRGNHWGD